MLFDRFVRIIKANLLSKNAPVEQHANEEYRQSHSHTNSKQQSSANYKSNTQEKAYYDALEVSEKASFSEIKAAYKRLVKKYHPDLFHNNAEKRQYAEIVTQKINEAYNYFEQKYGNR